MGVDMMAAEIVAAMKRGELEMIFPGHDDVGRIYPVSIEAALPCPEQTTGWASDFKKRYFDILDKCDQITYISDFHTKTCYHDRNRYMVDRSSVLIAAWDGRKAGGTWFTINYASRTGVRAVVLSLNAGGEYQCSLFD